MKLFENWRRFINEQGEGTHGGPEHLEMPRQRQGVEDRLEQIAERLGYYVDRKLGEGAIGTVYLVEDKKTGERAAMKVVTKRLYGGPSSSEREAENYQFAKDNKGSMPEKYAKYLPDVYEVVDGGKDYYIFMEVLIPLPSRVAQELFALPEKQPSPESKHERILNDSEATAEIIEKAIQMNDILHQVHGGIFATDPVISVYKQNINQAIKLFYDGDELSPKALATAISKSLEGSVDFESLGYPPESVESVEGAINKHLQDDVMYLLKKQIVPVHQGDKDVDSYTSGAGSKTAAVFPEAESLMDAMRYFKQERQWQPKDVHSENVMARPSTKDFVIVDLGFFDFGNF